MADTFNHKSVSHCEARSNLYVLPVMEKDRFVPREDERGQRSLRSSRGRESIIRFLFITLFLIPFLGQSQTTQQWTAIPEAKGIDKSLSDEQLLELVQKQSFRYFWDFAHPVSGLARERNNESFHTSSDVVTIGGSGFGVMAIIVAADRKWIPREEAVARLNQIVDFLRTADSYYGMWAHWLNGSTGETVPFSRRDNGADIVESAFMFQGLLTVRQY